MGTRSLQALAADSVCTPAFIELNSEGEWHRSPLKRNVGVLQLEEGDVGRAKKDNSSVSLGLWTCRRDDCGVCPIKNAASHGVAGGGGSPNGGFL